MEGGTEYECRSGGGDAVGGERCDGECCDHADVHANGLLREPGVLDRPIEALDRFAEALGDHPCVVGVIQFRDQEAEFIAAETGVQLLCDARVRSLLRDQVVGSNLLAKEPGHAIDDPVAQRVSKRVVVPLERRDIDEADRAPMTALFEGEIRFELLDEAPEIHQAGLRVAMHPVRQVGDELLEVLGNAADRGVARGQLLAHLVHALGEAGGDRLDRVLFGLLPEPLVLEEDVIDGVEQGVLLMSCQVQLLPHPLVEGGPCSRRLCVPR